MESNTNIETASDMLEWFHEWAVNPDDVDMLRTMLDALANAEETKLYFSDDEAIDLIRHTKTIYEFEHGCADPEDYQLDIATEADAAQDARLRILREHFVA